MWALSGNQATRNPKHVRASRISSYGHDDRKFDLGTSSLSLYNRTRHWADG
jgi:hypothetical protein